MARSEEAAAPVLPIAVSGPMGMNQRQLDMVPDDTERSHDRIEGAAHSLLLLRLLLGLLLLAGSQQEQGGKTEA